MIPAGHFGGHPGSPGHTELLNQGHSAHPGHHGSQPGHVPNYTGDNRSYPEHHPSGFAGGHPGKPEGQPGHQAMIPNNLPHSQEKAPASSGAMNHTSTSVLSSLDSPNPPMPLATPIKQNGSALADNNDLLRQIITSPGTNRDMMTEL